MPPQLLHFPVRVPPGFNSATYTQPPGNWLWIRFLDTFNERRGDRAHEAIDIFGARGLQIVTTTSGTVAQWWRVDGAELPGAGNSRRGGNFVRLVDDQGYVHYYAHMLDAPRVGPGDRVGAGQLIGFLSNTGTHRLHLHYQIRSPEPQSGRFSVNGYSTRGGRGYNPYGELVALGGRTFGGSAREGRYHVFPIPGIPRES